MGVFGLDSNEVLILHAAVMSFSYSLLAVGDSAEKKRMQDDCVILTAHFGAMLTKAKLQA